MLPLFPFCTNNLFLTYLSASLKLHTISHYQSLITQNPIITGGGHNKDIKYHENFFC